MKARNTSNVHGLRMLEFKEQYGSGSSRDTLAFLTNPTGNPRDLLVSIDGPRGRVVGQFSLDMEQASILRDWLEYALREPARTPMGAIADGTRIMSGDTNLTNMVDDRGMRVDIEVGPPPNKVTVHNGVLVERTSTLED